VSQASTRQNALRGWESPPLRRAADPGRGRVVSAPIVRRASGSTLRALRALRTSTTRQPR